MNVYPYMFTIFKIFGTWRPLGWSPGWKNNLYWMYTSVAICLACLMFVTQIMYIAQNIDNLPGIVSIACLHLTEVCAFCKLLSAITKRSDIIILANILMNEGCKPNSTEEITIQNEFDRRIRRVTSIYLGAVQFLFMLLTLQVVFVNIPERTLPFDAWIPFNHSASIGYWSALFHQLYVYYLCATMGPTVDCLVVGFMYQACAQLHILKYRLKMIPSGILDKIGDQGTIIVGHSFEDAEKQALGKCIHHHHEIFRFTDLLNNAFDELLFLQSAVASSIICMVIFQLVRVPPLSAEFISLAVFIYTLFVQILIFCWFSNELTVESMDVRNAAYAMDWTKLSIRTQKSLLIIMVRTLQPIVFTSGGIITWNLDMFISLVKLSYSMFKLLDSTS